MLYDNVKGQLALFNPMRLLSTLSHINYKKNQAYH